MMNNEKQGERTLRNIVSSDLYWREATEGMLRSNIELPTQAERYGHCIAAMVVGDGCDLSVKDLRGFVQWANNLDWEAVEQAATGSVFTDAEQLEGLARRVAHHSAKAALELVKSREHRFGYRIRLLHASRQDTLRELNSTLPAYWLTMATGSRETI